MNTRTKEVYSEVYAILNMLGENYINKLPKELYELIKKSKLDSYSPKYNLNTILQDKSIKREARSMIALLHLNYWCDTEEEKEALKNVFNKNDEICKSNLKTKNNLNTFSNPEKLVKKEIIQETIQKTGLTKIEKKENTFIKLLKKIFHLK